MKQDFRPHGMNIELTTCCPLHCPQCYCSLEGGKHIALNTAVNALQMGKELGVEHVELSGGETLCYPDLYELIRFAHGIGISPNIAISGWGFTSDVLDKLIEAGIDGIFVSLNGPSEEINRLSRDGYEYAINALEILCNAAFEQTSINWVMHRSTADTLPEMVTLAEKYNVREVVILTPKPTAMHELDTLPTREQLERAAYIVKHPTGYVKVGVESCFSPLLALVGRSALFGNINCGPDKGCGAGRTCFSVNVDGQFSPCRHLEYFESWPSLRDYWECSEVLYKIRELDSNRQEPCKNCGYSPYCRHCLAINAKLFNRLSIGNSLCPLADSSDIAE